MPQIFDDMEPRAALAEIARDFHQRGWMAGTAGNLSVRADASKSFWITASGRPKGRMDASDALRVDVETGTVADRVKETNKPSAETCIHQVVYSLFANAKACLHVHTVDAVIAADKAPAGATGIALPAIEMIKGFDIWEQDPKLELPLFPNILNVVEIANTIEQRFAQDPPRVTALMIRGHGVTVWGRTLQEAYNRVETLEFIMSYMARR